MTSGGQSARTAATGRLLSNLLETTYFRKWRATGGRQRGEGINQRAVARVIADYLIDKGHRPETDLKLHEQIKNTVNLALNGKRITGQTLDHFIAAFEMEEEDAERLWAALGGTDTQRVHVESFNMATGESRPWHPEPRKLDDFQPQAGFYSETAEACYHVNEDGLIYKGERLRVIRATQSGFQIYRWGVVENPDTFLPKSIRLGVEPPAEVIRVTQFAVNGYSWEIRLPRPLDEGETYPLRFTKIIEATGLCSPWVSSRTRNGKPPKLSVIFEGPQPSRVWWFASLMSSAAPGLFAEERRLTELPTGEYSEENFPGARPDRPVGIAWGW